MDPGAFNRAFRGSFPLTRETYHSATSSTFPLEFITDAMLAVHDDDDTFMAFLLVICSRVQRTWCFGTANRCAYKLNVRDKF